MTEELKEILLTPKKEFNKAVCKKEALENLKLLILPSGISYDTTKVQTSPKDTMPEYAAKMDQLEREYKTHIRNYLASYKRAENLINRIENKDIHRVMYEHYLTGKTFEKIREDYIKSSSGSACDLRTIYRWRKKGAEILENELRKKKI